MQRRSFCPLHPFSWICFLKILRKIHLLSHFCMAQSATIACLSSMKSSDEMHCLIGKEEKVFFFKSPLETKCNDGLQKTAFPCFPLSRAATFLPNGEVTYISEKLLAAAERDRNSLILVSPPRLRLFRIPQWQPPNVEGVGENDPHWNRYFWADAIFACILF